jgi:hypothetical protein
MIFHELTLLSKFKKRRPGHPGQLYFSKIFRQQRKGTGENNTDGIQAV